MRLTLQELGHPQPPTPICINNSACVGIVNNTQKRTRSRAMENKYFWLLDSEAQKQFSFNLHPGQENMGDYPSKAHPGSIHRHVRPFYLHMHNSPTELPRAAPPSSRRGCAETLADPYYKRVPLPKIPGYRKLDREASYAQVANTVYKQPTQTPQFASIVNSYSTSDPSSPSTSSLIQYLAAKMRSTTTLAKYATPTDHRYFQNPYRNR